MQDLCDHLWAHQHCGGHKSNIIKFSSAITDQDGKCNFNHALSGILKLDHVQFVVTPEYNPSEVPVYTID